MYIIGFIMSQYEYYEDDEEFGKSKFQFKWEMYDLQDLGKCMFDLSNDQFDILLISDMLWLVIEEFCCICQNEVKCWYLQYVGKIIWQEDDLDGLK